MRHVLSYSRGKDSTAMYLLALERGFNFLPVFADTGNEHPLTVEYVRSLPKRTGGPEIRWVSADFAEEFARKRRYVADMWPQKGVSAATVARALEVLHPTGVPFLDLCMVKGRFPSTRRRFCSQELKHHPVFFQVIEPLLSAGQSVVNWVGVRAEESLRRAHLPKLERLGGGLWLYRPLLRWPVATVFVMHRRHGIEPNPLYRMGCGRVGCMPCIHARKDEIRTIAARWPEHIERIAEWERLVAAASKRGNSTFFAADKTPGRHTVDHTLAMPDIREVVRWSRTTRGGRQFDLWALREPPQCSSLYGLCE